MVKKLSGTILMHQTSVHVYKDAGTAERNQANMEIRLDEKVNQRKRNTRPWYRSWRLYLI